MGWGGGGWAKTYLTLEIPAPSDEEDEDGNAEEGGAEGFAQLLHRVVDRRRLGVAVLVDGRVEPEQLRHGDADGGEGQ